MARKLVIPLFIVALGASFAELPADTTNQCVRFPAAAPAKSDVPSTDDVRVSVKSDNVPNINSGPIDLDFTPPDAAELVARRAGKAVCLDAFAKAAGPGGMDCTRDLPAAACVDAACCDAFDIAQTVILHCNRGGVTDGFELSRTLGEPFTVGVGAFPGGSLTANITHMAADNRDVYTDLTVDIAPKALIQLRPNGVTGTVQIRISHTQAPPNPRVVNIVVNDTNNDPFEAQALHNAIETALETQLGIIATTHPLLDAVPPLTAFTYLKQASHFTEITNITAANITQVEVIVPPAASQGAPVMGFTIEGSDNTIDTFATATIPTLNTWGIVALVIMLALAGYVLRRRQMTGTATT